MHVSLDIPNENFDLTKSKGAYKVAVKAIDLLNEQGIHIGINCVISRANFDLLEDLVKFCLSKKIKDISFLRFKPIGRANKHYFDMRLSNEQNLKLFPKLRKLQRKYKISIQVDCSMVPMIAYHKPRANALDFFGAQGCEGGNTFIEIKETSEISSCSFSNFFGDNASNLDKIWDKSQYLEKYRNVIEVLGEPCKSCKYLTICRGGCHVISEFITDDFNNPDPECPILIKYQKKISI